MFRKLIAFIAALSLGLQPLAANALDLSAAFENLTSAGAAASINSPGRYQSGARDSFVAGGLDIRVPRTGTTDLQLFSFTPPRIEMGCNGISAHFGGFSFISGEEFEKMLKAIASGAALGFVSMLTLKGLCPMCEAVVQFLKTAAQQASRLSIDSCKLAQERLHKLRDGESSAAPTQEVCGTRIDTSADSQDFLSAMNNACSTITKAVDSLVASANVADDPKARSEAQCAGGVGNFTWQRLKTWRPGSDEASVQHRLVLMNLLGAEIKGDPASPEGATPLAFCTDSTGQVRQDNFCMPTMEPKDLMGVYLCGMKPTAQAGFGGPLERVMSGRLTEYCKTYWTQQSGPSVKEKTVMYCADNTDECNWVMQGPAEEHLKVEGQGLVFEVARTLSDAVKNVVEDKPLTPEQIGLIDRVPYPLYQAINVAAVYPAAAADLMESLSTIVAEHMAVRLLDEFFRMPQVTGGSQCVGRFESNRLADAIGSMRGVINARYLQIGQNMATQQAVAEQIRMLNLAIQKQVLTEDVLAQGRFAESVGKLVTPAAAKP